jgi:hypothetical protein
MPATTFIQAHAHAVAALVGEPDVADVLAHLVTDCAGVMNAHSVAILARDSSGELSLLAATSHRATEIEMLQVQRLSGPCIDVIDSGEALTLAGAARFRERWDRVGQAIVEAGFDGVESYPMRWRGTVLGGLNIFRTPAQTAAHHPEPGVGAGQAFADIATLAVAHSMPVSTEQAAARLNEALVARELVEQAKGIIAYVNDVDLNTAYETLLRRAEQTGDSLTHAAESVVRGQQRHP